MLLIDQFAYTNGLRHIKAGYKFLFALIMLVLAIGLDNIYVNLSIFVLIIILELTLAKFKLRNVISFIKVPIIFILLGTIFLVIGFSKENHFSYSLKIFGGYFGVIEGQEMLFLKVFMRSLAATSSVIFLSVTTPMVDIIKVFKTMHLPNVFIELFMLIYRFIFIMIEEAQTNINSLEIKFGFINTKTSFKSIKIFIENMVLGIMKRNEEMINALNIKLYDGEFPVR